MAICMFLRVSELITENYIESRHRYKDLDINYEGSNNVEMTVDAFLHLLELIIVPKDGVPWSFQLSNRQKNLDCYQDP